MEVASFKGPKPPKEQQQENSTLIGQTRSQPSTTCSQLGHTETAPRRPNGHRSAFCTRSLMSPFRASQRASRPCDHSGDCIQQTEASKECQIGAPDGKQARMIKSMWTIFNLCHQVPGNDRPMEHKLTDTVVRTRQRLLEAYSNRRPTFQIQDWRAGWWDCFEKAARGEYCTLHLVSIA